MITLFILLLHVHTFKLKKKNPAIENNDERSPKLYKKILLCLAVLNTIWTLITQTSISLFFDALAPAFQYWICGMNFLDKSVI